MATSRRRARRLIDLCISNPNPNPIPSLVRDIIPYSYAMYGYAGYAKHGYVIWLYHCGHVGYAKNLVTPHGYAT